MVGQTFKHALQEATGSTWEAWIARLQGEVSPSWPQEELRAFIGNRFGVSDTWAEWLALMYGQLLGRIPVGVSKDAGVQIGVRKTFRAPKERAWAFLASDAGLPHWIGASPGMQWEVGAEYATEEGGAGKITVVEPLDKLRLTWKRPSWERPSRVQFYTLSAKSGTTVSIHQEMLEEVFMRETMRLFRKDKLQAMKRALEA